MGVKIGSFPFPFFSIEQVSFPRLIYQAVILALPVCGSFIRFSLASQREDQLFQNCLESY